MLLESPVEASLTSSPPTELHQPTTQAGSSRAKRLIDVAVTAAALVLLSVLLLTIAAAIFFADGGPVLIRHRRIGKGGRPFGCLKFRTMVVEADTVLMRHLEMHPEALVEWQAMRKLRNDPRVTPLGTLLRKTSLDELPQLVNIIRGEMSLVGPRPIVAEEIVRYGAAIADYKAVRPGLTGLWQCSGRNDVSYECRVILDREYVRTWSLWNDLSIILKTVPAVVASRGVY